MEAAAPARAALAGSASRANVVRNGTAAPAERVAVEGTLAELRRAAERALRMPVVQRLLDEEGEEVRSVADIRHEQTLFACAAADEPFLRQRSRRCQVFRCSAGERGGGSGGAARWQPDRWHQGKVLPVPERMRELQAAAGAALRLTTVEETAVRFRSVSTGQLIWSTEAIVDDELLVVELDPSDLRAASEEREPSPTRRESGGGAPAAAAASWRAPGWGAGRGGARRPRMRPPPRSSYSHSSSSWSSSSVSSALREDLEATGAGYVSSASSSSEDDEEPTAVDMRGRRRPS